MRAKRHTPPDGRGVPTAVIDGNIGDKCIVGEALDAAVLRAPREPRRPEHVRLDKDYDYEEARRPFEDDKLQRVPDDAAQKPFRAV